MCACTTSASSSPLCTAQQTVHEGPDCASITLVKLHGRISVSVRSYKRHFKKRHKPIVQMRKFTKLRLQSDLITITSSEISIYQITPPPPLATGGTIDPFVINVLSFLLEKVLNTHARTHASPLVPPSHHILPLSLAGRCSGGAPQTQAGMCVRGLSVCSDGRRFASHPQTEVGGGCCSTARRRCFSCSPIYSALNPRGGGRVGSQHAPVLPFTHGCR